MSMADARDPDEVAFDLAVGGDASSAVFPLPMDWYSESEYVGDMHVTAIRPNPGTSAELRANGLPLVTLHDVGLNAQACFASFFSCAHNGEACPEVYSASAHYHLTAPGHTPGAPSLGASASGRTFESLADSVVEVLERFHVRRAIGIGAGAGASVLLHAALARPNVLQGLVLVSPLLQASGYAERGVAALNSATTRGLGLGRRAKDRLLTRWLSPQALDENHDLVTTFDDTLDRLNVQNMMRFMEAEAWRTDLASKLSDIKAKVLLVTGKESPLRIHTADCFSMFDPARTSWLDVEAASSLVMEEHPERVAKALRLFLQGFGPISISPAGTVVASRIK